MKTLALTAVIVLSLLGVLVWVLRGDSAHTAPDAEKAGAVAAHGDASADAAALEREPAAPLERAEGVGEVAPAGPQSLPDLAGERVWEEPRVPFFGTDLTEVAHLFVLENRGAQPITFVSARAVTTSTTLSSVEWPLALAPGQRMALELVNKLRAEQDEKTSRAELVTDKGEIVTLTLRARAAR